MKDGYQAWCKTCWKAITDKRRNGPKREIELRQRQNRHLIRSFGMTIEEYEDLLERQNYVCAICKRPPSPNKKLAVDHRHRHDMIRGLLCGNCNRGLGMFKDDIAVLKNAVTYLS